MTDLTPIEASEDAVDKAKMAQRAIETARETHQAELVGQTKEALLEALREVFGKGDDKGSGEMNVLVERIPFICNEIKQIHKDSAANTAAIEKINSNNATNTVAIEKINSNTSWLVKIIIGALVLAILKVILIP